VESGSRSPCNRKNLQLSESQTFDRFHEFLRRAGFSKLMRGDHSYSGNADYFFLFADEFFQSVGL